MTVMNAEEKRYSRTLSNLLAALLCVLLTAAVFSGLGLIRNIRNEKAVKNYFTALIGICADDISEYRQTGREECLDRLSCDLNAAYYFEHYHELLPGSGPHFLNAISELLIGNREKVLPELDALDEVLTDYCKNQSASWLDGELNRIYNRITHAD